MTNFRIILRQILEDKDITPYAASQIIGANTKESIKTVHQRLMRWLAQNPKTWREIDTALNYLGYEIVIRKREQGDK